MNTPKLHPVRQIKVSSRAIVGTMSDGSQYESSLERDFIELVRFDKNVERYTTQPLTIEYHDDKTGAERNYTPDLFVEYRRDINSAKSIPHTLYEIKYREDFRAQWRILLPKFRAAKSYCKERGWSFAVMTEVEVRTPYLQNVRFLSLYRARVPTAENAMQILDCVRRLGLTDPAALLCSLFAEKWRRIEALPVIWYLIAEFQIGCDLSLPLTMKSSLWINA